MARSLAQMMTFWRLQGLVKDDHVLYWQRPRAGIGESVKIDRVLQVRKAIVGKKHGTRAEIIYRAVEWDMDANPKNMERLEVKGMINADLIFDYRDEQFITKANLGQLELHLT